MDRYHAGLMSLRRGFDSLTRHHLLQDQADRGRGRHHRSTRDHSRRRRPCPRAGLGPAEATARDARARTASTARTSTYRGCAPPEPEPLRVPQPARTRGAPAMAQLTSWLTWVRVPPRLPPLPRPARSRLRSAQPGSEPHEGLLPGGRLQGGSAPPYGSDGAAPRHLLPPSQRGEGLPKSHQTRTSSRPRSPTRLRSAQRFLPPPPGRWCQRQHG